MTEVPSASSGPLHHFLHVLSRRRWIVLAALVVVPLVAVTVSLGQVPLYEASADVLLSHQDLASTLTGTQNPNVSQAPDRVAETQARLARVRLVARRTLEAAGVTDETPGEFLANSGVSSTPNADLLEFRVTDKQPARAVRLATEYAHQFTIYRRRLDTGAIVQARSDVRAQIKQLKASGHENSPLYASLVEKDQQLGTMEALQSSNAYVVQSADQATQVQPRPVRTGVMAGVIGLVLGIGLAFLLEALDTPVRSATEVGERLGLPLLARLPEPPRSIRSASRLVMVEDPTSHEAEAFRVLRTNLDFVNLTAGARTIMITSAVEGEGKSTTAANLAVALARSGRRVVLVDLDLRRPFLDHFFHLPGPGVTEVAVGQARLDEALARIAVDPSANGRANGTRREDLAPILERAFGSHPSDGDGTPSPKPEEDGARTLELLPSGPLPPNVGEFMGTAVLTDILEQLRERADIVLIDTTPLLHIGDAIALSAKVDALIVVTRLNLVRRPVIAELARVLESCPAAKLGFVLAGAEADQAYGYGGYGAYRPRPRHQEEELQPSAREPSA
jgi:succinoglycan biosynthesis transport protein ExoP